MKIVDCMAGPPRRACPPRSPPVPPAPSPRSSVPQSITVHPSSLCCSLNALLFKSGLCLPIISRILRHRSRLLSVQWNYCLRYVISSECCRLIPYCTYRSLWKVISVLIHAEQCSGNRTVVWKAHPSVAGRIQVGSIACLFLKPVVIGRVS